MQFYDGVSDCSSISVKLAAFLMGHIVEEFSPKQGVKLSGFNPTEKFVFCLAEV